ncbi:MAG: peptidylprolyl isomerase [Chloroflexi bacterium]|nr:peptidylprolyl isomerase [Chloroflexota bacterium]
MPEKAPSKPITLGPSRRRQLSRWQKEQRRARTALVLGVIAVVAILVIPAYGYYTNFIVPPRQWVVKVNGVTYTLGYVTKILRSFVRGPAGTTNQIDLGTEPIRVVIVLAENELIRQAAPRYNIAVTDQDVDQELQRRILGPRPEGDTTPPEELERAFREQYRQYLIVSGLSAQEQKQLVRSDLYRQRMRDVLGQDVPAVLPQVHLYQLTVDSRDKAQEAQKRFSGGTPFKDLVSLLSIDDTEKRKDGEVGWIPRDISPETDDLVFGLAPGALSDPQEQISQGGGASTFNLYLVTEKADARDVSTENREALKTAALQKWLDEERPKNDVQTRFNSDMYAWIVKQIGLTARQSPTTSG